IKLNCCHIENKVFYPRINIAKVLKLEIHYYVRQVIKQMSEEKIIRSRAPPYALQDGNFLKTLFKDANKWMTKHAIECSESGVTYTYSELLDQIKTWSGFLRSLDLDLQDPVTIISSNCLQYVPILLGTISLGIPS
ncbi:hypothetical protein Avbf_13409, partial [Armadillidium vulgare]